MNNFLQALSQIKNPQSFIENAMKNNQLLQNPVGRNAIEMIKNGDKKGTEELARNLLKERGLNPDEVYNQVKQIFGGK